MLDRQIRLSTRTDSYHLRDDGDAGAQGVQVEGGGRDPVVYHGTFGVDAAEDGQGQG